MSDTRTPEGSGHFRLSWLSQENGMSANFVGSIAALYYLEFFPRGAKFTTKASFDLTTPFWSTRLSLAISDIA